MPTSEIRALLSGPTTETTADHCPSCTCMTVERVDGRTSEGWQREQRAYNILERLARRGAVEKSRYPHSREVYWRLVEPR
jgi:hypothetical protein